MDDEKLIECVREYKELYDMSHKKYSDNLHKDKLWSKIGNEGNMPGPACKARWISLRDQLRKALKKNIPKSGQAATARKKWKYEDCMSFLIPYFKERETKSNIGDSEEANEELNSEGETHDGGEKIDGVQTNDKEETAEIGANENDDVLEAVSLQKRGNAQFSRKTLPNKCSDTSASKARRISRPEPETASSV
nr:unnamed protein product [Callosobruchus chinensis]